jgi:hypothetical protein
VVTALQKEGCSMSEQWNNEEVIIEQEIEFYLNYKKYEEEIQQRLKENELNIQYPVTKYDSDSGRIHRSCPGTEDQAIRRIEVRDALNSILEKAQKRINRLLNAYNQLSKEEQDIVFFNYLDQEYRETDAVSLLGLKSNKELNEAKINTLKKMYFIYQEDRADAYKEFMLIRKAERERKAKLLREQLYKGAVQIG